MTTVPRQQGDGKMAIKSALAHEHVEKIAEDIKHDANSYFQRFYGDQLSIEEMLEMLKKLKNSTIKRDREVFSCMIKYLFQEYKWLQHQYPDKALQITAQLYGRIINEGLVPNEFSLGLALGFTLDALRKPEGSRMYYFGIAALDCFKSRLKDYHKYCEHVSNIPHFNKFPPYLMEYIKYGLEDQEPPLKTTETVHPENLAAMLNQSAVITVAPPKSIQDKTAFIFNNLSLDNLKAKSKELKEIISNEYFPWLSQYIVKKRVSREPNFHKMYSEFLDALKIHEIKVMVIEETYCYIRALLYSDKIASVSNQSLLKNLGQWLGMITLAHNRPIFRKNMDLKALLREASQNGEQALVYVVPFVVKVLESCAISSVYKPKHPWTISVMKVLAEIYNENLKNNLQFEIELLFKKLNLNINQLKAPKSSIYSKLNKKRNNPVPQTMEQPFSQPKWNKLRGCGMPLNSPMPQMQQPPSLLQGDKLTAPRLQHLDTLCKSTNRVWNDFMLLLFGTYRP